MDLELIRNKSWDKISKLDLDVNPSLPLLENLTPKSFDEIYDRLIILNLNQLKLNNVAKRDITLQFIEKNDLFESLTDKEKKLHKNDLTDLEIKQDLIQEVESLYIIAWILDLIKEVDFENKLPDSLAKTIKINQGVKYEDFKKECLLREIEQIVELLDFLYCLDWTNTNQRIMKGKSRYYNYVIKKRRHAIEWSSYKQKWDDIILDT